MKQTYPGDIMLCFVEGFGNGVERGYNKSRELSESDVSEVNIALKSKKNSKRVSINSGTSAESLNEEVELLRPGGKSLRLSSRDRLKTVTELKRSFSDRFSIINDAGKKKAPKGILTIKKTWSTGNFAGGAGGAAGGGGAPRSAPATPLQLEPHPRHSSHKHDKHVVKPLSGSAPSVRVSALGPLEDGAASGAAVATSAADGKPPGKARQKKFQRHFPQVGPDERVLNYYSCALVGDLLLQGHLYITKNYFAFYSNVFGYVTKVSIFQIRNGTLAVPPPQELRSSEVELEASEYSPEDDSSSAGADHTDAPRDPADPLIAAGGVGVGVGVGVGGGVGAAVIQPALLTGGAGGRGGARGWHAALALAAALLALSAAYLAYRLAHTEEPARLSSGGQMYAALVAWRSRLHGRAADELHAFLSTNLLLLAKVRQSLETLSGVILTDMGHDVPNDTAFS
ncbi:PREDICTED: uncharacterized protein LOC106104727 [Papilio polytes]|uniref:uncharacterized protein LOC106104727 n=1 Tax=Papilio polytes TaxID=76194 RepID=UPI0006760C51|nr:PREDICTED: uncharacterized protein LOC106104727 [Papilio polytes]